MEIEIGQIMTELREIKLELNIIKQKMPDKEMFLTLDEKELLENSYKNEKEGKLVSSKNIRKQLGI